MECEDKSHSVSSLSSICSLSLVSCCICSCLAHVINLASQALIAAYSKTKFFDPEKPDEHIPDLNMFERDIVGLVRAITVKVTCHLLMLSSHCWFILRLGPIICKEKAKIQESPRTTWGKSEDTSSWYESSMVFYSRNVATSKRSQKGKYWNS